jgi:prefoldin subunit 4
LTKEEEDAMGPEVEVRREDQDKINKFSRLHQHELAIEEDLKTKNVSSSPRRIHHTQRRALLTAFVERKGGARRHHNGAGAGRRRGYHSVSTAETGGGTIQNTFLTTRRYKIGDAFFHLPLPQAQEMLGISTARLEEEIEELEDKMGTIRGEMTELKVDLYARFGKTINLET